MPPPTPSPAPGAFTTPDRHGTAGGATPGSVGGATPYSVGGATPAGATPGVQRPAPTEGRPEQAEAVLAALDAAKGVVAEVLGREARAMLLRRVSLADGAASSKLAQLANALNLFISPDGESDA